MNANARNRKFLPRINNTCYKMARMYADVCLRKPHIVIVSVLITVMATVSAAPGERLRTLLFLILLVIGIAPLFVAAVTAGIMVLAMAVMLMIAGPEGLKNFLSSVVSDVTRYADTPHDPDWLAKAEQD